MERAIAEVASRAWYDNRFSVHLVMPCETDVCWCKGERSLCQYSRYSMQKAESVVRAVKALTMSFIYVLPKFAWLFDRVLCKNYCVYYANILLSGMDYIYMTSSINTEKYAQSLATDMRRLFYSTWPPSFSSHIKKGEESDDGHRIKRALYIGIKRLWKYGCNEDCFIFGEYFSDEISVCMTLALLDQTLFICLQANWAFNSTLITCHLWLVIYLCIVCVCYV